MLTCITCSKQKQQQQLNSNGSQRQRDEIDDFATETPRTKQAVKALTAKVLFRFLFLLCYCYYCFYVFSFCICYSTRQSLCSADGKRGKGEGIIRVWSFDSFIIMLFRFSRS